MAKSGLFQRTFPMLENFEYTGCDILAPVTSFLGNNPTIKHLRIDTEDLMEIPLNASTGQLNCLSIEITISVEGFVERLKTLHANGFYETLHIILKKDGISGDFDFEAFINEMISISGLKVLVIDRFTTNLCQLTQLKELQLFDLDDTTDLTTIALNLINLERLWMVGTVNQLIPFLCHSKKLKKVILDDRKTRSDALNLLDLNQMRQKGEMHRKVQIGAFEDLYLETKWKSMNVTYDLIEITRAETIHEHFYYVQDYLY